MNLIRKILLVLTVICSVSAYSQEDTLRKYPMMMVFDNDTVIVYSLEQAKELTLRNEQRKECLEVSEICELQLIELDTIIKAQEDKIENFELIVEKKDTIIQKKDDNLDLCEQEKAIKDKEIRKQKIGKWVAIGSAVVIGVFGIIF
jgi:flagellar biosynthesis chaperone FliJ